VEEAVHALCAAGAWEEAAISAGGAARCDLLETDIIPGCLEALEVCVANCRELSGELCETVTALAKCRALRAAMGGEELFAGTAIHWESCLEADSAGGGDQEGEQHAGGGGEEEEEDARSLWSEATSVVTTTSTTTGGLSSSSSGVSGASTASSRVRLLAASAKSSGVFSHLALHGVKQRLEDTRRTISLAGAGEEGGDVESRERKRTEAASRVLERRSETAAAAAASRGAGWQGRRGKAGKKGRPGSRAEEEALENTLARILPTVSSPFFIQLAASLAGARSLGAGGGKSYTAAAGLVQAWEGLLASLQACTLPTPRLDMCAFVAEARRSRGVEAPMSPALLNAILGVFPPPAKEDPVDALREFLRTRPTLLQD